MAGSLDDIRRAVEMTAQCEAVDYDWRASPAKQYCAILWCNVVGERICGWGDDAWTAVQAAHALCAMYENNPAAYRR